MKHGRWIDRINKFSEPMRRAAESSEKLRKLIEEAEKFRRFANRKGDS